MIGAMIEGTGIFGIGTVVDNVEFIHPTARIWHNCVIRDGVYIGANSVIGHSVVIERDTKIGENTTIQSQCHITADATIGDYCFIAPNVVMGNEINIANHGRCEQKLEGPTIGNGVRISALSYIAAGVTIGDNAFIEAMSLVTRDVPSGERWGMGLVGSLIMRIRAKKVGMVPKGEWL